MRCCCLRSLLEPADALAIIRYGLSAMWVTCIDCWVMHGTKGHCLSMNHMHIDRRLRLCGQLSLVLNGFSADVGPALHEKSGRAS